MYRSFDSFSKAAIVQLIGAPNTDLKNAVYDNPATQSLLNKFDQKLVKKFSIVEKDMNNIYKVDAHFEKSIKNFFMFGLDEIFEM